MGLATSSLLREAPNDWQESGIFRVIMDFYPLKKLEEHLTGRSPGQILQIIEDSGYQPLAVGSRRVAIDLGDSVVKVAHRPQGYLDNQLEWLVWQNANSNLRLLLCPCKEFKEGLLIQEKCLPLSPDALKSYEKVEEIQKSLASFGIGDTSVNMGLFEQRVVCYDYSLLRPSLVSDLLKKSI